MPRYERNARDIDYDEEAELRRLEGFPVSTTFIAGSLRVPLLLRCVTLIVSIALATIDLHTRVASVVQGLCRLQTRRLDLVAVACQLLRHMLVPAPRICGGCHQTVLNV